MISDALESVSYSHDRSTLSAFATFKGGRHESGDHGEAVRRLEEDWQLFNMNLYARVVNIWNERTKQVDPSVKTILTANTYGPSGFDG